MIIVKLIGGLGNQMFQYAAARRLAEKHSTILKLDITGFEEYKLHKYSLHCFLCWEYLATDEEIKKLSFKHVAHKQDLLNRIKQKFMSKPELEEIKSDSYIIEKYFHFNESLLELPDNILLDGYWQSEKYFADITDILRREFVVKYRQDPQSRKFADLIQNTESISLHVRRTDYVQNTLTNQIHGTCDKDYYDRSVRYIGDRISNPHFFIFSDEPQWAKDNLQFDFPMTVVDCNNASRNYEDLRLMSMCRHNIIANSSFSWWGAWLNDHPNKIVTAPRKWFNNKSRDTKDLIPSTWVEL
jgi:hypothetical protein